MKVSLTNIATVFKRCFSQMKPVTAFNKVALYLILLLNAGGLTVLQSAAPENQYEKDREVLFGKVQNDAKLLTERTAARSSKPPKKQLTKPARQAVKPLNLLAEPSNTPAEQPPNPRIEQPAKRPVVQPLTVGDIKQLADKQGLSRVAYIDYVFSVSRMATKPSKLEVSDIQKAFITEGPDPLKTSVVWQENATALMNSTEDPYIVGGNSEPAPDLSQVFEIRFEKDQEHVCSACLIAPGVLLTAGHCFRNDMQYADNRPCPGMVLDPDHGFRIQGSVRCPYADLGLVFLENGPASVNPSPQLPEELWGKVKFVDIAGYGSNEYSGTGGIGVRRHGLVSVTPTDHPETYGCHPKLEFIGRETAVGADSCNGDSGGPAFVTLDGTKYVCGVVSRKLPSEVRGVICGQGGIYVRVDKCEEWINAQINNHNNKSKIDKPQ